VVLAGSSSAGSWSNLKMNMRMLQATLALASCSARYPSAEPSRYQLDWTRCCLMQQLLLLQHSLVQAVLLAVLCKLPTAAEDLDRCNS
jgi:hypothetical protein